MSYYPPGGPGYQPGQTLDYQTTRGFGSAPTLVLLHGIFMAVMGGINGLGAIFMIGFAVVFPIMIAHTSPSSPAREEPPVLLMAGIYGGMGVLCLGAGMVQTIAAVKLLRKRPGSWGWGLAAAIVSCCELWCGGMCALPLAAGVFGIVAMALDTSRRYMASWGQSGNPYGGY